MLHMHRTASRPLRRGTAFRCGGCEWPQSRLFFPSVNSQAGSCGALAPSAIFRSMLIRVPVLILLAASTFNVSIYDAREAKADPVDRADVVNQRLHTAASYSCSPRKYCKQMSSCAEARWALHNCSWGSALDRDGDGVPCETICGGR